MKETTIKILMGITIFLITGLYIRSCTNFEKRLDIANQNALADKNELKRINATLYQKYVKVESISDSLLNELKNYEETLLAKNETILVLKNIIEKNSGVVITDTLFVEVPSDCIGLRLGFSGGNSFYKYTDTITVLNPPIHKLSLSFSPINATSYLTRNKEGIWSGYLKLNEQVADYILVDAFNVKVDEDLYFGSSASSFSLIPHFIINTNYTNTQFGLGVFSLINDAHLIGYGKSINSNFHTFTYGYKLNF